MPPPKSVHSWHGADRDVLLAVMNEDWQDQVGGGDVGL